MKKLFSHRETNRLEPSSPRGSNRAVAPPAAPVTPAAAISPGREGGASATQVGAAEASAAGLPEPLRVPLSALMKGLPAVLRQRVVRLPKGEANITLPWSKVWDQLPRGAVKVSFGEVRRVAPSGVFDSSDVDDAKLVNVPLAMVLSQLQAGRLNRRPGQRPVALSDSIGPVFTEHGGIVAQSPVAPDLTPKSPPPRTPPAVSPRTDFPPSAPTPSSPGPAKSQTPVPAAKATASQPASAVPSSVTVRLPKSPLAALATSATSARPAAAPPAPSVVVTPAPPAAVASAPKPPTPKIGLLEVTLESVVSQWPGPIQSALAPYKLSLLSLPLSEVERGLKQGKLAFTWGQLCAWVEAGRGIEKAAVPADALLPLPLNVLIPLFMGQRQTGRPQRKITIAENIPDPFLQGAAELKITRERPAVSAAAPTEPVTVSAESPTATPASAPTPKAPSPPTPVVRLAPAPAPPPSLPEPSVAPAHSSMPSSELGLAELFGQPGKTHWTPVEIVQKTSGLPGVGGAVIALQDGFLVATQLPPELNGEVIAAFLPQMFGRMSHYTRELKLGETSALNLVVNDQMLQIFKAGPLFLLVLGKPGESLPAASLHSIVAQLTPQSQPN